MGQDTRIGDYLEFLEELGASGNPYFLEGGQAVNFWAEYFSARGAGEALAEFRPFTSKDCDLWVSRAALLHIQFKLSGGSFLQGDSPADGQIGVFTLRGSPPRRIDLMTNVYGIRQATISRLVERAIKVGGVTVIDPIFLFQSKCHCLLGLDQGGRQDEKHLQILCHLLPWHFREALDDTISGITTQRALIQEIKLLLGMLKTRYVRRALGFIGVDHQALIPNDRLSSCGLTKVERFAETALDKGDTA